MTRKINCVLALKWLYSVVTDSKVMKLSINITELMEVKSMDPYLRDLAS